ncbi:alpha/beta hydrolase [Salinactinospora qingdaonensis]|uniref:Alpha/beta hydrolase family protein n=1 Tax=Salinactinospora qingdaonensis TaxID=702744 RepID=A0ABP7FKU7_9ACTN
MPAVVGIHGIGCENYTPEGLTRTWNRAIDKGLLEIGHSTQLDFSCVGYGHLFLTERKGLPAPTTVEDLDEFEVELLLDLAQPLAAAPMSHSRSSPKGVVRRGYAPRNVQWMLEQLARHPSLGETGFTFVLRLLHQVRLYLADLPLRESVHAEVEAVVGADTRVVVGHSLGSVVAYDALRRHPEWQVDTLVTLGSPLGVPGLMRRMWPPLDGERWPGSVTRWVNVAAREDAVALVKELATLYDPPRTHPHVPRLRDDIVRNSRVRAHRAESYLQARPTARAIRDGLGGRG